MYSFNECNELLSFSYSDNFIISIRISLRIQIEKFRILSGDFIHKNQIYKIVMKDDDPNKLAQFLMEKE